MSSWGNQYLGSVDKEGRRVGIDWDGVTRKDTRSRWKKWVNFTKGVIAIMFLILFVVVWVLVSPFRKRSDAKQVWP